MHFEECAMGDYRIYAGAMEAPGGYVAAVVVNRMRGVHMPQEAFRDTALSGGYRWPSASAALSQALKHARTIIREEPQRLNC